MRPDAAVQSSFGYCYYQELHTVQHVGLALLSNVFKCVDKYYLKEVHWQCAIVWYRG